VQLASQTETVPVMRQEQSVPFVFRYGSTAADLPYGAFLWTKATIRGHEDASAGDNTWLTVLLVKPRR
jgi:hypothetical protein